MVEIRDATDADAEPLATLWDRYLVEHYGLRDKIDAATIVRDGIGPDRRVRFVVAEHARVSAVGGAGGAQSEFATGGGGGNGGLGRIRLSITPATCTAAGTFNPPLAAGCTPVGAKAGNAYVGTYPN